MMFCAVCLRRYCAERYAGQNSSIFIRGTNSSHVPVLIDGVRLNLAGVSGSADLSQFPVSLQRIEYIPRSAPGLFMVPMLSAA